MTDNSEFRLKMFRYTCSRQDSFNAEIWLVYMLSQTPIAMATRYLSTLKCYDCNSSGLLCKVPMCISTLMHAISKDLTSSFLHAGKTSPDQYYIAKLVIQLQSCQQCNPTQNPIRPRFQQQLPRQRFIGSKPFPNQYLQP